ncbi:MAG TPA: AAA family ATPase [Gaiellaceae bacterium]|nr:AAA family ATPase [Gaiellaceae bacterium]
MGLAVARGRRAEQQPLVGRADELTLLQQLLEELDEGAPAAVELVGEAGIGKTRLLRELMVRAEQRHFLVLAGSASELERDLPFSAFVDALDEFVESLERDELSGLDDDVQAELAHVFPSLSSLAGGREVSLQHERYRSHRAVRALLELLAAKAPLVLVLDDFHWADSASVELLGALLRRPPGAAVLLALALRPRASSERLAAALDSAHRAQALTRLELPTLTAEESRELLGAAVAAADAGVFYEESGGNPFYLEQLARPFGGALDVSSPSTISLSGVPALVLASLSHELSLLSPSGRLLLDGAAVAGDPFEPELAAAAAALPEAASIDALDELLQLDLVGTTEMPRRFRFRHPLVRRAVYEDTAAAWRLGAHERCSQMLMERGASAASCAHHVERSARQGDLAAVAVLREAGAAAARLAPESAARWFGVALRLLPETEPAPNRVELLLARAEALAAAGRFADSHEATLEAAAIVPEQRALQTTVTTACAEAERFLGRYEQAHERLVRALDVLPDAASLESTELLIELTLNEFYRSRYDRMHHWAERAVQDARRIGDDTQTATALVMRALAGSMTGPTETARAHRAEAAAVVDELSDEELSNRPDAAGWLAIAEVYLDLYGEADAHASRALALARATGSGDPLHRLYPVLPRVWYIRGKLAAAAELLDGAIEAARLIGSPPALAGNLFNRSAVALAAGDVETAIATAEEAVELTRDLDEGLVSGWAAVRLAAVLLELGQGDRALGVLLAGAGGEELTLIPAGWRAYALELLTRCSLACARPDEAESASRLAAASAAAVGLPLAGAWADRAAAVVALHSGDAARAVEQALASADAARGVGAPIEEALSRTLAGRALAQAGRQDAAVAELQRAAAELDACGALRYRDQAERELGKLGRRIHRRTRPGKTDGVGIETLTARELQVAQLVVDRRTNPEIAAQLFLSNKTVESHLRNIFRKMSVASRVELARAVERATRS